MDGHEREDVVQYRVKFLEQMAEFERFMPIFSGDNMEVETSPFLLPGEKVHILVTHDESIFSCYDGAHMMWMPKGEQPIQKKGQGRSLHVSDFLTDVSGRLALSENQQVVWRMRFVFSHAHKMLNILQICM